MISDEYIKKEWFNRYKQCEYWIRYKYYKYLKTRIYRNDKFDIMKYIEYMF